ncbi:hypothetical protein HanRHA438_Chr16g0762711 [Helianthus annuus]|nr:hypothetical protein HanRHA438_Chr16g0762711 [Helianthus annuus]
MFVFGFFFRFAIFLRFVVLHFFVFCRSATFSWICCFFFVFLDLKRRSSSKDHHPDAPTFFWICFFFVQEDECF